MILPLVKSSFNGNACHEQTVHIVSVPYSIGIFIFLGVNKYPHRNSAIEGLYHCIRFRRIRDTKHVDVELYLLRIDGTDDASSVIVRRDRGRRKIQFRI